MGKVFKNGLCGPACHAKIYYYFFVFFLSISILSEKGKYLWSRHSGKLCIRFPVTPYWNPPELSFKKTTRP